MRQLSAQQIKAVLALDGPARFRHFVKRAADEEQVWGLWNDGWALMEGDGGGQVFPMWPAQEYATLLQLGEWTDYTPRAISLEDLLGELLPRLSAKTVGAAVFPTPAGQGVVLAPQELSAALEEELANYG